MTTNKDFWDNTLEHCSKEDKDYIASVLCKQIMYERDLAIQQLKDLGYGLGEKPKENKGKRDLISRGEVESVLHNNLHALISTDQLYQLYRDINHLPIYPIHDSAENKGEDRPKGRWIGHREHCENLGVMPSGLGAYEWCSNCDCGIDVREWHKNHYNFCPNCGADMRPEPYKKGE